MAEASVRPHNTGIYEIVNTVNGKRYVGSAVTIRGRFAVHRNMLRNDCHHSRKLQNAWNKYGELAFEFRKLLICAKGDLIMYEQIALDAMQPEYNILKVAGSALGHRWDDEARERARVRNTLNNPFKGRKHTAESAALISAMNKGRSSPTKGKPRKPEAVAATAAAHRGMKRSEETKARISAKAAGRTCPPRTAEHRAKLSAASKGRKLSAEHAAAFHAGRVAHIVTDAQREKLSAALKRTWQDGTRSRIRSEETRTKLSKAFARLTEEQVREMRRLHAVGATGRALAMQFGVPPSSVSLIVRHLIYRWVLDE